MAQASTQILSDLPVIVVGGGWAGLAAAVELAAAGVRVEVLEAAPQLGGRARGVRLGANLLDNGQHLLIGGYRDTLRLLRRIGVADQALLRRPLHLQVQRPDEMLELAAPPLPAPLHLLLALWRGLRGGERRAALRFCLRTWRQRFRLPQDISVAQLLTDQPPALVSGLWEPLCLATLNTPLEQASALLFLRVLHDAFNRRRRDSDLLFPRSDLGTLLPQPAAAYIANNGGSVTLRRRVDALAIDGDSVHGVVADGRLLAARAVIVATAPWHALRLLGPHAPLRPLAQQLLQLRSDPIATVYLHYPVDTTLGQPMLGMSGTLTQWVFDRGLLCDQPGLMAAVISGPGAHTALPAAALCAEVAAELARQFPHWPAPLAQRAIREQRATFRSSVGVDAIRPDSATAVRGLWLAGDYTATGYPSTLEGAVRSGVQCARRLVRQFV